MAGEALPWLALQAVAKDVSYQLCIDNTYVLDGLDFMDPTPTLQPSSTLLVCNVDTLGSTAIDTLGSTATCWSPSSTRPISFCPWYGQNHGHMEE